MHIYLIWNWFFALTLLHIHFQWSAEGITQRLQHQSSQMQYTQMPWSLLISLILHVLKRRRLPGWFCCRELQCEKERVVHWASGMGGKDAERDGNSLSPASSCHSLSGFRSSATEWKETNKSEERQAGKGDTLPQESTCLVDLFLGTLCANYTISLWGWALTASWKVVQVVVVPPG